MKTSKVALVKTEDRARGIPRAVELLEMGTLAGRDVLLKPNFNTADPYPGSTHNDTLSALVLTLRDMGAGKITVGDRSGPADTARVLADKGVDSLCARLGVDLVNFEELPESGWVRLRPEGSHWRRGFDFARPVLDAGLVVTTGCIKTHRFGAVFTMALKLSIGMVHQRNMRELHTSLLSMRRMIAEVNVAYRPALVLLDGIEVFVDGGPMEGTRRRADVILAGDDRVAVDAVALAMLKKLGTTSKIMDRGIFDQEQISRAVELGLGAAGPGQIEIVAPDEPGRSLAGELDRILKGG